MICQFTLARLLQCKTFAALILIAAGNIFTPALGQVLISEFLAVNSTGISDEDGDRSDWIELYNAGSASVNLGGWHLTDKASDLTKWEISPVVLKPGEYRMVWASNKNRKDPDEELHTNFKLSGGGEYLALVHPDGLTIESDFGPAYPAQTDDVSYGFHAGRLTEIVVNSNSSCRAWVPSDDSAGLDWTYVAFDDSSWTSGVARIGYENNEGYESLIQLDVKSIMNGENTTLYTRIPFVIPEGILPDSALLRMRYDDGFRAYINGTPIADVNISGSYAWNEEALDYYESTDYVSYSLSSGGAFHAGTNMLAIHGVNDRINSSDFLIIPELTIYASNEVNTNQAYYFAMPSPGSGNFGGTENIGPQYSKEQHLPAQPTENDDLQISVKVIDKADGVTSVSMIYEIMYTGEVTVVMFDDGLHGDGVAGDSVFGATIPASEYHEGEMIRYRFSALDGAGHTSRWPMFHDPVNSPEFFGTMAQIDVPSSMPVYHWFVEDEINKDTVNESRSSLFFEGKLYDNIMTRTRGGSTDNTDIIKKSHKFDFNRSDHFEYDVSERKVEEMNLNTLYTDKTYLRRMISWKSYEDIGAPGCKSFLVHLRRNNEFFGVQNFEEQVDDDFLSRHGFDPNGKLYKVVGWGVNESDTGYKTHRVAQKTRKEDVDTSDVHTLIHHIQTAEKESYIFDNMDVANVINYMTLNALMRDGDIAAKNHYLYRDTDGSGDWSILPWDKDLVFGMNWSQAYKILHDGAQPPNNLCFPQWSLIQKAVWDSAELKALYLRRLRTVVDQLLQPASTPAADLYYENMISDLLLKHESDLLLDYNKWGNPWAFGSDFTPSAANQDRTIDNYLIPARSYFYNQGLLPEAQAASFNLEISHVEAIPTSGNQAEEYIELFNPNNVAVDISGWSLSNAVTHVFESGSVILPNDTFYVSPDTGAFRRRSVSPKGGEHRFVQGPYKGMLSSRGETLDLYDAHGALKDSETWGDSLSDAQRYLRVSEVMYHPALPSDADFTEDHLEFVELKNTGPGPLDIGGTFFTEGLLYTNPAVTLAAGEYLVVASDPVQFAAEYNTSGMTVVGPFSGYLANGNDAIELEDHRGETIQRFEYNDDWYPNTDGHGFSLTFIDPAVTNFNVWSQKDAWRSSLDAGGSPGSSDSDLLPGTLIINEVLAHSDTGGDWVEIKNMSSVAIDLSYWFLSDDRSELKKYAIPNDTILPANGFTVLHEADFNRGSKSFALSELGDEVILNRALADGTLQGYQVSRDFDASGKDISFGRWIDSEGDGQFIPMAEQTPGTENSAPRTGPVLISEIMYAPALGNAEYIELYNSSAQSVSLFDPLYPTNSWSLSGAVDYTFPYATMLESGSFLIVSSTNPAAFRAHYAVPPEVEVLGPFSGNLNNGGERIKLVYPGNPEPTFVPQIQLESINYKAKLTWPVLSSAGISIERISTVSPANDPSSWQAATAQGTPGVSVRAGSPIDTLSDVYKIEHFGSATAPNSGESDDFDLDGKNNLAEFIAGTDPNDPNDAARVEINQLPNGHIEVSILTRKADATDFGLQRYYWLQQRGSLTEGSWTNLPGASNIKGTGQIIRAEETSTSECQNARALIELK